MTLPPVVVGQAHTAAHNAERAVLNALQAGTSGGNFLILGATDPIPEGTAANTVIIRKLN